MSAKEDKQLANKWDTQNAFDSVRREAIEKKSYEVVSNLLAAGRFTISEIANFATVTEDFVKEVRADLLRKK